MFDPSRAMPKTERQLPIRTKFRAEKLDPRCTKSRMLINDPNRAHLRIHFLPIFSQKTNLQTFSYAKTHEPSLRIFLSCRFIIHYTDHDAYSRFFFLSYSFPDTKSALKTFLSTTVLPPFPPDTTRRWRRRIQFLHTPVAKTSSPATSGPKPTCHYQNDSLHKWRSPGRRAQSCARTRWTPA